MNRLIYKVVNFVIEITNLTGPNLPFLHAKSYSVPYPIAFSSFYGNRVERMRDHLFVSIFNDKLAECVCTVSHFSYAPLIKCNTTR